MGEALDIRIRLEDGRLWATVAEYRGVVAAGDTLDELRGGIALYLAKPGGPVPDIQLGPLTAEPA